MDNYKVILVHFEQFHFFQGYMQMAGHPRKCIKLSIKLPKWQDFYASRFTSRGCGAQGKELGGAAVTFIHPVSKMASNMAGSIAYGQRCLRLFLLGLFHPHFS